MRPSLYDHQRRALRKTRKLSGRCGIFHGVGCGKTRTAILAARRYGRKVVVVAPLSAMGVWRQQVRQWSRRGRTVSLDLGNVKRAAEKMRRVRNRGYQRPIFVLVNWDAYWRPPLCDELLRWQPDVYILDEAHRMIQRRSKRSRFMHRIASPKNTLPKPKAILPLTATPSPNGAQDIFSVFKGFDPSVFGSRWPAFTERYIKMGGFYGYQIVGYDHEDELAAKVAAHSHRVTTDEALDLPPQQDVRVPVKLSEKTRTLYDKMASEALVHIDAADGGGVALSRIVLTNQIRLSQMSSGFVRVESGGDVRFGDDKQRVLADLLSDVILAAQRVVIFCRFTMDVEAAIQAAAGVVGEQFVYRLDGRVKPAVREAQIKLFRAYAPSVIVGQLQVASLSIDLSCAPVSVFYSKDWSLLDYEQARGRLHRKGQTQKVTHYHLIAEDTIDERIHAALAKKGELQKALLDKRRARRFFGG